MYHIIIAGGSGTRFWPYSREKTPKQLLKIVDKTSLIRLTVDRLLSFVKSEKIYIVAKRELCKFISDEIPEISRNNFIIEPSGKNTAPAILASALLKDVSYAQPMIFFPADHLIEKIDQFNRSINLNKKHLSDNNIFIFGIKPNTPSTQYGYF